MFQEKKTLKYPNFWRVVPTAFKSTGADPSPPSATPLPCDVAICNKRIVLESGVSCITAYSDVIFLLCMVGKAVAYAPLLSSIIHLQIVHTTFCSCFYCLSCTAGLMGLLHLIQWPHFHGHLKPSVSRSVVCSRLRPISMGTLKPPYSRSVVWSRLRCPSKHS